MRCFKTLPILIALALPCALRAQTQSAGFEYAIVMLKEPTSLTTKNQLIISYANGREEDFAKQQNIHLEKGFAPNAQAILKAFAHMDEQGYELVSSQIDSGIFLFYQYVFRKKK